jgi:hypothetical protein
MSRCHSASPGSAAASLRLIVRLSSDPRCRTNRFATIAADARRQRAVARQAKADFLRNLDAYKAWAKR